MDYNDIASVQGKGGLFKVLSTTRGGVVLEALDGEGKRFVAGVHQKVSVLSEISIYTRNAEGSTPLADVFKSIEEEFGGDPDVDTKSNDELKSFLKHVLPDYDEDRVYPSDIKKVLSWYLLLRSKAPELLGTTTEDSGGSPPSNGEEEE